MISSIVGTVRPTTTAAKRIAPAGEVEAGEAVRHHRRQQHRQDRRGDGDERGVEEVASEVVRAPGVGVVRRWSGRRG